jgi:predicted XRE-type DNA-binding protein
MKSILKEDYPDDIRDQFKDAITKRGIRQDWIAKNLQVSQGYISNILTKKVYLPEVTRTALNELLGTNI